MLGFPVHGFLVLIIGVQVYFWGENGGPLQISGPQRPNQTGGVIIFLGGVGAVCDSRFFRFCFCIIFDTKTNAVVMG